MRSKRRSRLGFGLAFLSLLWGISVVPAQAGKTGQPVGGQMGQTGQQPVGGVTGQAAPVLTTQLVVNGAVVACGTTVTSGSQVCLRFSSNQGGTATILSRAGAGADTVVSSGTINAGTPYNVCVTAGAADGQTRTLTVMVTNAAGLTSSQPCSYVIAPAPGKPGQAVGGQTGQTGQQGQPVGGVSGSVAPILTTRLVVNGAVAACGATVTSGSQVCLQFASDQSGSAVVLLRTGTGADTVVTSGNIAAGTSYSACVTAGAADGQTYTFTLRVTNAAGQTSSQVCSYVVAQAGKPGKPVVGGQTGQQGQAVGGVTGQAGPILSTHLLVNGAAAACGATVVSGSQVCLRFTSDQGGTAVILVRKGATADTVLASGTINAGTTYSVCVTAGAADGLTRTLTLMVTNAAGQTSSQPCTYVVSPAGKPGQPVGGVKGKAAPVLSTSLTVNGAAAACGAIVASGSQVCLRFSSDQSGTAVILSRTGAGADTVVSSGTINAGTPYSVCVTAGAADGQTRTFTLMVTNASGQTTSQPCSYVVAPVAGKKGQVGGQSGQSGQTGLTLPSVNDLL